MVKRAPPEAAFIIAAVHLRLGSCPYTALRHVSAVYGMALSAILGVLHLRPSCCSCQLASRIREQVCFATRLMVST